MHVRAVVAAALAAGSLVLAGCGPATVDTAAPRSLLAVPVTPSSPDVVTSVSPSVDAPLATPAPVPVTTLPPPAPAVVTTPAPVVKPPVPVPLPVPVPAPRTTVRVPSPAPVPMPARTVTPPVAPAAPAGSLGTAPIQKPPSGNFYKAGQFCPKVDAGTTTQDASGRTLLCTDNNGLRWEPA